MKNVLIQSGLAVAPLATDSRIRENILGSWMAILIISNKKMENITKAIKSLKDSNLLIKGFSERLENEVNEQKDGILCTLLKL